MPSGTTCICITAHSSARLCPAKSTLARSVLRVGHAPHSTASRKDHLQRSWQRLKCCASVGPVVRRSSIDHLQKRFLLLLTGTPIQNNMSELFSMLNLLDPGRFSCGQTFLQSYGNPPSVPSTPEQLGELQVRATSRP